MTRLIMKIKIWMGLAADPNDPDLIRVQEKFRLELEKIKLGL